MVNSDYIKDQEDFSRREYIRNKVASSRAEAKAKGAYDREELRQIEKTAELKESFEKKKNKRRGKSKSARGNEFGHEHDGEYNPTSGQGEDVGFFGRIANSIYDKNNGGMQWGYLLGGIGGTLLGGFAGNYMATAGGVAGSWLGAGATILLALSGAAIGSRLANDVASSFSKNHTENSSNQAANCAKQNEPNKEAESTENKTAAYDAARAYTKTLSANNVQGGSEVTESASFAANVPRNLSNQKTENKSAVPAVVSSGAMV